MSEDLIEVLTKETNLLSVDQLQAMIAKLSQTEDGISLKDEMSKLKVILIQNPSACAMLDPEDVGTMTKNLYRMANRGILDQLNPAVKKKKIEKLVITQEDIDKISMEDLL